MNLPLLGKLTLALTLTAASVLPASAATLSIWARASSSAAAQHMVDLWNSSHQDQLELTTIPDNQMVTKLATSVQSGDVPDLISFDLIFMPDFMKAGFLTDLTDTLGANPNQTKVAKAFRDLATYDGKLYGTGFTPDVSILLYNKGLFKKAGLDPEKPPTTIGEIEAYAKKIHESDPSVYGYYFSGSCGGCNIFTQAPMMWGSGATLLPTSGDAPAMEGTGVKEVLTMLRNLWTAGAIPESAEGDNGSNFQATFETGVIGMQGSGGFAIASLKANHPEIDFGIAPLPGVKDGDQSSFVGGDVIAVPKGAKNADLAIKLHRMGTDRRGPARRTRQEPDPAGSLGSGGQQVLPGRAALHHDRKGRRNRPDSLCLPLQRYGQCRSESVADHAADRGLRWRHRWRDCQRGRDHEGYRRTIGSSRALLRRATAAAP